MIGRTRALHLSGASALAIGMGTVLAPVEAYATCTATPVTTVSTVTSVNVVCAPGAPAVLPFFTSYGDGESQIYDGNGNDRLTMTGGSVLAGSLTTPQVVPAVLVVPTFNLDESTGVIEMLGGNDVVDISGGTIGDADTAIGIVLGAGADTFRLSGGTISGSVFGQGGGNTYVISGGTIGGSLFAGSENDNVTISGTAVIQHDAATGTDAVALEDGNDTFNMTGGTLGGSVSGNAGNDIITVGGGTIGSFVAGNEGDDQITISGGAIADDVRGNQGFDTVTVSGGAIAGSVEGEAVTVSGGTIGGWVFGGLGADTIDVSGGIINQSIYAGGGNDIVTISNAANVLAAGGNDSVALEGGDDIFNMTGGTVATIVSGGAGNDLFAISGGNGGIINGNDGDDRINVSGGTLISLLGGIGIDTIVVSGGAIAQDIAGEDGADQITVSAGSVGGSVNGGDDNDQVAVSGGIVNGSVNGGAGTDAVTVSGGTINGNVTAESVTLTGGTIGGDILGLGPDTLTIDDSLSAAALDLRNGVIFSGVGANGFITDTNLAVGGAEAQVFTGFANVTLDNATLGFGTGAQGIANALNLGNGSTLFVNGSASMPGAANVTNSLVDMRDGVADDIFTLGGLALNNAQIGIDVNQQTAQADQLVAAAFSATGTNTIIVNLLGTPQFAEPTDIPIIVATNGPVPGTFVIQGVPGTTGSLFTYELVPGANGGLALRASPANFGVAASPVSAVNAGTVDTAVDALYGINDDAIDSDLNLANGTKVQISPSFGVFASGQFAHTEHDGYTVTNGSLVGQGPSFDADDFSAAISLDFNAAKHFGFDSQYGLNLGLFAGYASTDVGLGAFQGFDRIGDGSNKSGMFGGYALFRQGFNYALVSASAFIGNTDVSNGVLATTGSYDTQGYAVTGSVGHIFMLSDRARFDLRGGLLGVSFSGDSFVDSGGNEFGESKLSFGAVKLEPGVYADFQLENGMVLSPYARAELQQRFSYKNEADIDTRKIGFDDADFSAALSTGFNTKVSQSATVNGEVRGKWSADSSTVGAKLGLKVAF